MVRVRCPPQDNTVRSVQAILDLPTPHLGQEPVAALSAIRVEAEVDDEIVRRKLALTLRKPERDESLRVILEGLADWAGVLPADIELLVVDPVLPTGRLLVQQTHPVMHPCTDDLFYLLHVHASFSSFSRRRLRIAARHVRESTSFSCLMPVTNLSTMNP